MPDKPRIIDENDTRSIINQAEVALQGIEPTPFSPNAFTVLKEKIGEYISQLMSESSKVAKRHRADTISAAHVERASEYLVASTSRRFFRHLGTIGGLMVGASAENLLSMASHETFTPIGTIVTASIGFIGMFLVALHFAKD